MWASFWSCPTVRLSRTWRRMNSGGSEGGEAPALTTLPQLWTERRPGARVETGDGMETETESRPPPPPPATSLLCPRHRQPRSHDQTHRRGGEAGVLGGPARWRYCITAGLHMRHEPSVNTASCREHGHSAGRGGAARCCCGTAPPAAHHRHNNTPARHRSHWFMAPGPRGAAARHNPHQLGGNCRVRDPHTARCPVSSIARDQPRPRPRPSTTGCSGDNTRPTHCHPAARTLTQLGIQAASTLSISYSSIPALLTSAIRH